MTLSLIDSVAAQMVTELNATTRTWYGRFTAAREDYPVFGPALDVLTNLTVRVIVRAQTLNQRLTRGAAGALSGRRKQNRIDISVQQKVPVVSNENTDPLKLLTEQIQAYFLDDGHDLGLQYRTVPTESTIDPYPSLAHLEEFGAYTAIIQLTYETT